MEKKKYNFPEVKLGQYKGLAITRHVRPVTEKTLDIEMVHQTRMHATYRPTQEPAKRGCRALLDFAGYMDGKEIPDSPPPSRPSTATAPGRRSASILLTPLSSGCRSSPARPPSLRSTSARWPRSTPRS